MKTVLLIGLGRFGRHLAMQLNELGHQVMAVDKDEERVNECMSFVTNAQIGDSTRLEFLRSLFLDSLVLHVVGKDEARVAHPIDVQRGKKEGEPCH